nr:MAG TPA: hypothetical protein [Caudoviricetes sp.]
MQLCAFMCKKFSAQIGGSLDRTMKADIFPNQAVDGGLSLSAYRGNVHAQGFGRFRIGLIGIVQRQKDDLRLRVHSQDDFVDVLYLPLLFFQGVYCPLSPGGSSANGVGHFRQLCAWVGGRLDAGRVISDGARVGPGPDVFQIFFQGGALGFDLGFYGQKFLIVVLQDVTDASSGLLRLVLLLCFGFGVHAVHLLPRQSLEGKIAVFFVYFLEATAGHVVGRQASGRLIFRGAFGVRELHFIGHNGKPGPFVSVLVGVRVNLDPAGRDNDPLSLPEILRHELRRLPPGDDRNEVRFLAVELPVHGQGKGRHRDAGRRVFQFRIARQASGQFHVVHIESPSFHLWANFVIRYSSPQGSFFWARPHRNRATPIFNDCQVVISPVPLASLRTNDFL